MIDDATNGLARMATDLSNLGKPQVDITTLKTLDNLAPLRYTHTTAISCTGELRLSRAVPNQEEKTVSSQRLGENDFGSYAVKPGGEFVWVRAGSDGYIEWSCNGQKHSDLLQGDEGMSGAYVKRNWGDKDILLNVKYESPNATFVSVAYCAAGSAPRDGLSTRPTGCFPTWNYTTALATKGVGVLWDV